MDNALVVYEPEAAIVRMMFENYLSGQSTSEIARDLNSRGIKTKTGKSTWRSTKVAYILGNERYCGDCKYQKTYRDTTVPFKQFRNRGQEDMFYASMTHAPLIDRDTFDKVQLLLKSVRMSLENLQRKISTLLRAAFSVLSAARIFAGGRFPGQ